MKHITMNHPYLIGILTSLGMLFVGISDVRAARPIITEVPRAQWSVYGINPWKIDTDNDGFADHNEILDKYCPTSADPISITDVRCKKGTFNLKTGVYTQPLGANFLAARAIKKVRSCSELTSMLRGAQNEYRRAYEQSVEVFTRVSSLSPDSFGISQSAAAGFSASTPSFTATNVQVQGVDEGDLVKTDGRFIYYLTNNNLVILSADATAKEPISVTPLGTVLAAESLYLSGSSVVVVGTSNEPIEPYARLTIASPGTIRSPYPYYRTSRSAATVIDVSDAKQPTVVRHIELTGNMLASRLTRDYLYLVLNVSIPWTDVQTMRPSEMLPHIRDVVREESLAQLVAGELQQPLKPLSACSDVEYLSPRVGDNFVQIVAIPVGNPRGAIGKKVVWGMAPGAQVYVSPSNIYIAAPRDRYRSGVRSVERTELYKFTFEKNKISLVASQTVPGRVLNQFSMDEHNGLLRLATTESVVSRSVDFVNHLLVLNDDLSRVGSVDAFSPTEKIYSARFMGNRAYVVTFRTIDPFIVFDLSNPRSPQYIGELKIPGFSNYLHPYDERHVIGIGRDAAVTDAGGAFVQGLKLGLFDVTNPNIPTMLSSVSLGDRGSDSEALYDHHALLFEQDRKILALPVVLATLTDEQKNASTTNPWATGRETFAGLVVYDVDVRTGFKEMGRVTHFPPVYNNDGSLAARVDGLIRRSILISEDLYAFSAQSMTIHDRKTLTQRAAISF